MAQIVEPEIQQARSITSLGESSSKISSLQRIPRPDALDAFPFSSFSPDDSVWSIGFICSTHPFSYNTLYDTYRKHADISNGMYCACSTWSRNEPLANLLRKL